MNKTKLLYLFLFLIFLFSYPSTFAWEEIDKIVAVIGDKAIVASELDFQIQLYAMQSGIKLTSEAEVDKLKREMLQQMINSRLILIKAKQDTSIIISSDEIDIAFQQRLDGLKSSFGSEAAFNQQMEEEGLSFRELKVKLQEEVSDQIYQERLINKLLSKVSVSKNDVENFFIIYQDSLPNSPASMRLAHIYLKLKPAKSTQDSLKSIAIAVRERIIEGEDFELLAAEYSNDPSAEHGGDIGTFKLGDLVPEYEKAAMALKPEEISEVVKTTFGFHIIKLVEKTSATFHSKHILFLNQASSADSVNVNILAEKISQRLKDGEDFGLLVKEYSDDEINKTNDGDLGWFSIANLPDLYLKAMANVEVGEISKPVWDETGLHLIKLLDRREDRKMTLEDDWDILKNYARQQKSSTVITSIVDEMKDKVHLEVREF